MLQLATSRDLFKFRKEDKSERSKFKSNSKKLLANSLNILSVSTQKMQPFYQRKVINEPALLIHHPSQEVSQQSAPARTARWVTAAQPRRGVRQSHILPHAIVYSTLMARNDTSAEGMPVTKLCGPGWDKHIPWLGLAMVFIISISLTTVYHTDLSMCTKRANMFCQSRLYQDVSNCLGWFLPKGKREMVLRHSKRPLCVVTPPLPTTPIFSRLNLICVACLCEVLLAFPFSPEEKESLLLCTLRIVKSHFKTSVIFIVISPSFPCPHSHPPHHAPRISFHLRKTDSSPQQQAMWMVIISFICTFRALKICSNIIPPPGQCFFSPEYLHC